MAEKFLLPPSLTVLLLHCSLVVFPRQACERDVQCGGGMCCAVSLWIRGLRMCAPMGREGDDCHPISHKVPFFGKRLHHTCPCLPNLACIGTEDGNFACMSPYKSMDSEKDIFYFDKM
ncbi:prokineticin-2 [Clupea harengus]|uniref:Prokineticin-2 n=1 Tax=Clupea harengus TaxID=7950 RepID=A0A6P3WAY4_CLUHA|nr:prokineticin-2 [Clupea harengus]